ERRSQSGRGEFLVVWGRRRVGKTELLSHFLEGRRGVHFEATEGLEPDHLHDLTSILQAETGSPLLAAQGLANWQAGLAAIADYARTEPTVVILDEFQWIAHATPDLGSLVNRWWREVGRLLPILLIVSGSEVAFFERDVLTGTMFGRRTGQLQLAPFDYRAAGLFFPGWSPEDRVRAYAVCGGMPYYLEQFDERLPLEENLLQAMLYRSGVLHEEAKLLLHEELPEPQKFFSILRAIANGATRHNQIAQRTGVRNSALHNALGLLRELYLVRRKVPVTAANPDRTKQTSYEITDGYLRFYFRFMHPFESRLKNDADAGQHLRQTILPNLDEFVSRPTFEEVCQEYLRAAEGAAAVGSWWGQVRQGSKWISRELDGVALDGDGNAIAIASCKWTSAQAGVAEEALLTRLETELPKTGPPVRHYFFSKSGFDSPLTALAAADPNRIRLVAPGDLYAQGRPARRVRKAS
ncbi:MAG: ATP-binding protein, partial [Actinobacteria bacterium]|nr:ATP-binding protein [Actinomycetota bacterium]